MAVPSSGEIRIVGIYSEKNESDYTAFYPEENNISLLGLSRDGSNDSDGGSITLNAASIADTVLGGGLDQLPPHSFSEFYSYDHDYVRSFAVFGADDWNDGNIGSGTRDTWNDTDLEAKTLFEPASPFNSTPGTPSTDRVAWVTSGTAVVVSDTARLRNTTVTAGSYIKTTDYFGTGTPNTTYINLYTIPETQAIAWRFRFFMNSTNNKDQNTDVRMSSTNYSPSPGQATLSFLFQIRDNAGPNTGAIYMYKRNGSTQTNVATSPTTAYTLGTTQDFVYSVQQIGTGRAAVFRWKAAVGPTTTPTQTLISTNNVLTYTTTAGDGYNNNFGWTFRAPRFMSTPTSTHYHAIDVWSVSRITL